MTKGNNVQRKLTRLEGVLDTFGADSRRWPGAERRTLEALIEKNADARRLLGEASAMARLMDAAPAPEASAALKSRIVAAAIRGAGRDARVVPIKAARSRTAQSASARRMGAIWPAAALAASFAFGLYLGAADIGGAAVDGAFEIAMSGVSNTDADSISWLDDGGAVNEEGPL